VSSAGAGATAPPAPLRTPAVGRAAEWHGCDREKDAGGERTWVSGRSRQVPASGAKRRYGPPPFCKRRVVAAGLGAKGSGLLVGRAAGRDGVRAGRASQPERPPAGPGGFPGCERAVGRLSPSPRRCRSRAGRVASRRTGPCRACRACRACRESLSRAGPSPRRSRPRATHTLSPRSKPMAVTTMARPLGASPVRLPGSWPGRGRIIPLPGKTSIPKDSAEGHGAEGAGRCPRCGSRPVHGVSPCAGAEPGATAAPVGALSTGTASRGGCPGRAGCDGGRRARPRRRRAVRWPGGSPHAPRPPAPRAPRR
jgi:hypothetical protein